MQELQRVACNNCTCNNCTCNHGISCHCSRLAKERFMWH